MDGTMSKHQGQEAEAGPHRVGVTAKAPREVEDIADLDLPPQRSIKRTNISAHMTVIVMCLQKITNIPTKGRNIHVPGARVCHRVDLQTGTSPPAGKSTTKTRTITIPPKDIPQNAGETATQVQEENVMINTDDS